MDVILYYFFTALFEETRLIMRKYNYIFYVEFQELSDNSVLNARLLNRVNRAKESCSPLCLATRIRVLCHRIEWPRRIRWWPKINDWPDGDSLIFFACFKNNIIYSILVRTIEIIDRFEEVCKRPIRLNYLFWISIKK